MGTYGWYLGLTEIGGPNFYRRGEVAKLRLARNHNHSRQALLSVVEHEMGHAIGLHHGPGVMAAVSNGTTRFSTNDIAVAQRIYGPRRWVPAPTPTIVYTPVVIAEEYPVATPDEIYPVATSPETYPVAH